MVRNTSNKRANASSVMAKISATAGETLVETLVAVLIVVLALTIFPVAVMAAGSITSSAEDIVGTCPVDRGQENLLGGTHTAYVAFRTASKSGNAYTVGSMNMAWEYDASATDVSEAVYTATYTGNGSSLTKTSSSSDTQNKIDVNCYVNKAEGGDGTLNYYFYDSVAVKE